MKNVVSVKHFHTNQPEAFWPEICNRSSWSRQWRDSRRLDSSGVKSKSEKYRGGSALINHCHSMTELKNGSSVRILVLRQVYYSLPERREDEDVVWWLIQLVECCQQKCGPDESLSGCCKQNCVPDESPLWQHFEPVSSCYKSVWVWVNPSL